MYESAEISVSETFISSKSYRGILDIAIQGTKVVALNLYISQKHFGIVYCVSELPHQS